MPDEAEPFAHAGDRVTCEAGHGIFTITQDLYEYSKIEAEHFSDPCDGMKPPKNGDRIRGECPQCGADWMRPGVTAGFVVHLESGGWQPNG